MVCHAAAYRASVAVRPIKGCACDVVYYDVVVYDGSAVFGRDSSLPRFDGFVVDDSRISAEASRTGWPYSLGPRCGCFGPSQSCVGAGLDFLGDGCGRFSLSHETSEGRAWLPFGDIGGSVWRLFPGRTAGLRAFGGGSFVNRTGCRALRQRGSEPLFDIAGAGDGSGLGRPHGLGRTGDGLFLDNRGSYTPSLTATCGLIRTRRR